jgi:hypothetical protein
MVVTASIKVCFCIAADRVEDRLTPVSVELVDVVGMAQVAEVVAEVPQVGQAVTVVMG